jgi:hypothetical protein
MVKAPTKSTIYDTSSDISTLLPLLRPDRIDSDPALLNSAMKCGVAAASPHHIS